VFARIGNAAEDLAEDEIADDKVGGILRIAALQLRVQPRE
jgi:hypothetical protein